MRWCLFDFRANWSGTGESSYRIDVGENARKLETDPAFQNLPSIKFATNLGSIQIGPIDVSHEFDNGAIRRRWELVETAIGPCILKGHLDEFVSAKTLRIQLTLVNPQPADHPGGNWDLGNGGSVMVPYFNVYVDFDYRDGGGTMRVSPEIGSAWTTATREIALQQFSSGGENRMSSNQIDRYRNIPTENRGYTLLTDDRTATGTRSTPIVLLESSSRTVGVAVPRFWEGRSDRTRPRAAVQAHVQHRQFQFKIIQRKFADIQQDQMLGQHTDEILRGVLKKSDAEIAKLRTDGAV